jgi:hypothetical protein
MDGLMGRCDSCINRFFQDSARVTEPTIPPQTSPEIQRHFILPEYILETVADQAGLHGKMSEICHSIQLSHINDCRRGLNPRVWTIEDLKWNSIAARNDSNLRRTGN